MHIYVWFIFYAHFDARFRPYRAHIKTTLSFQASVSLSVSVRLSDSQYMYSNSRTTKHIFIKLNFGKFYKKKLPVSLNFCFYCTILTATLHEEADLHTFKYGWYFASLTCTCAFLFLPCIFTVRITLWKYRQVRKIKLYLVYFKFLGTKQKNRASVAALQLKFEQRMIIALLLGLSGNLTHPNSNAARYINFLKIKSRTLDHLR
jgi:hypothetical protein